MDLVQTQRECGRLSADMARLVELGKVRAPAPARGSARARRSTSGCCCCCARSHACDFATCA